MIFDLVFVAIALGALFTGYKNGLLITIVRSIFFIGGAIAAMYLVIEYDKTGWLIAAIIGGAYAAAWIGTQIAKSIKVTVIRGPLRWIDSSAGAIFEVSKYVILFYIVGTILLWAPWSPGQNSVAESKVYLKISTYAPGLLEDLKGEVERRLQ
jgi:hypothetical protein